MNVGTQAIIQDFHIFLDYISQKKSIELTNRKQAMKNKL